MVRRQQRNVKIYEVWCDGYDGCDETDSFWFSRKSAEEAAARRYAERPSRLFQWEVLEHEVSDLPPNDRSEEHTSELQSPC